MTTGEIIQLVLLIITIALTTAMLAMVRALAKKPSAKPASNREEILELKGMVESLTSTVQEFSNRPAPMAMVMEAKPVEPELAKPEPEPVSTQLIRTLEEELSDIEARAQGSNDAYASQVADQARHLQKIAETSVFSNADLEHVIACVFDAPALPGWQVSKELRELETRLTEARVEIVKRLKQNGVEPIYPVINQDKFDADLHVDAGGSPGTTSDQTMDQVIVEVLKPGICANGEVSFPAKIFRVQCAAPEAKVLSIDDLPERKSTGDVGW